MKRVIICIVIVAALTGFSLLALTTAEAAADRGRARISSLLAAYERGDEGAMLQEAELLEREWDSFADRHIFITDNEHIMEICASVSRIKAFSTAGTNAGVELLAECEAADKLLELYYSEQALNLWNIL